MRPILIALVALLLSPLSAFAACSGSDLRESLTPLEREELDRRLDATPYAEGLYWIARKEQSELHILGTVHMNDPRLKRVEDTIAPVLQNADRLFVEATREEQAKLQAAIAAQPDLVFITEGPTLPDLLAPEDWEMLAAAARVRNVPAFMAAKMQPWYLSTLLALPPCAMSQLQAGEIGLDHQIMNIAQRADIPQVALEPYDTLFKLMGQESMERQLEFLVLGLLPEYLAENSFTTLMFSYFDERPAEISEVARLTLRRQIDMPAAELDALFDQMLVTFLDARNISWVDQLANGADGTSVIAVGAGHLPGQKGILNLLAERGFSLERQPLQ